MDPRFLALVFLLITPLWAITSHGSEPAPAPEDVRLLRLLKRERELFAELESRADQREVAIRDNIDRAQRLANDYDALAREFPRSVPVLTALARYLQRTGHIQESVAIFKQVLALDPDVAVANQQVAHWFAESGDVGKALPLYLRAIASEPNEPVYHYDLGTVLFERRTEILAAGILNRAAIDSQMVEAFSRAAALRPENLDLAFRHAEALADVAEPDWHAVLQAWDAISVRVPETGLLRDAVRLQQARAHIELGQLDAASRELAAVAEDSPLARVRGELLTRIPVSR
jgi:tetratricopeptide (TPR) repeat protein